MSALGSGEALVGRLWVGLPSRHFWQDLILSFKCLFRILGARRLDTTQFSSVSRKGIFSDPDALLAQTCFVPYTRRFEEWCVTRLEPCQEVTRLLHIQVLTLTFNNFFFLLVLLLTVRVNVVVVVVVPEYSVTCSDGPDPICRYTRRFFEWCVTAPNDA